jgi:CDP-diacylglycerol--glycerol-3-phosphate 3-phosphatidyltransferase
VKGRWVVEKWFPTHTANILTSLRVLIVPFFALAVFGKSTSSGVLALILFAAGGASDYLDGHVARKTGTRSAFGEFLDPLADKLLTGSAFLSFAFIPELGIPLWLVIVIIAREVLLTLFRATAIGKGEPMSTEYAGKLKTAFQFFAITCILLILLAEKMNRAGTVPRPSGAARPVPLILVAVCAFFALLSLASYLKGRAVFSTALRPFSRAVVSSATFRGGAVRPPRSRGASSGSSFPGVSSTISLPPPRSSEESSSRDTRRSGSSAKKIRRES